MGNHTTSPKQHNPTNKRKGKKRKKSKKKKQKKQASAMTQPRTSQSHKNLYHSQNQPEISTPDPDPIEESKSAPVYSTAPKSEWHTMSDYFVLEQIRDFLTDQKIAIADINDTARQYILQEMKVPNRDKARFYNIITELCKQEGHYTEQLPIVTEEQSDGKESNEIMFDELTPATYIKKQNDLIIRDEYIIIRDEYLCNMQPLLKKQTHKTLLTQCEKADCPGISRDDTNAIFHKCESVKRINCLLSLYHKLMHCDILWRKVAMGPLVRYGSIYGHQQIFNDFLHIKLYHIDPDNKQLLETKTNQNVARILHERFDADYKCHGVSSCFAFLRHYRDRADGNAEKEMFHMIENEENMKSIKIRNEKEWVLQEECDKIHSYFLHSTIQYQNTDLLTNQTEHAYTNNTKKKEDDANQTKAAQALEIETEANKTVDEITDYAMGRSYSALPGSRDDPQKKQNLSGAPSTTLDAIPSDQSNHATASKITTAPSEHKETESKQNASKKPGYVGEKEDKKWLEEIDNNKADEEVYRLLVENMGIFRWQSAHGFRTGQNRGLAHLKPIWKNVKEEALNNSYSKASIDNWNSTLRKSKIFFQSFARHKIKTLYDDGFKDWVTGTYVEWQAGKSITLTEIVMLKLYTDFDKLQHELKKCFRWETIELVLDKHDEKTIENTVSEKDKKMRSDLENRLREFFYWRVGLLQVLNKYGQKIDERTMVLYHGVNAKMILNPAETMAFYGPLSTTSSYHVAKTFATAKGMVLKITSQYPRLDFCRAFDASLISDYPEEQEYLIGFLYMRVLEVRTRSIITDIKNKALWDKAPLASKMRVVFFAIHLFGEQMFSMSEHLEYHLVQFLKCHRRDCCSIEKHRKGAMTREQSESFLSFLCCEIAQHDKPLSKADWTTKDAKETKVLKILWRRFNTFRKNPNFKRAIKIDTISEGLKEFFLEKDANNNLDLKGNYKYRVSFYNLLEIFPDLEEVHYINNYSFDNAVLAELIRIISVQQKLQRESLALKKRRSTAANNRNTGSYNSRARHSFAMALPQSGTSETPEPGNLHEIMDYNSMKSYNKYTEEELINKHFLKKIVFVYYDYVDRTDAETGKKLGYPPNGEKFCHPKDLNQPLVEQLEKLRWEIKHRNNGRTGYKIRIQPMSLHQKQESTYELFQKLNSYERLPGVDSNKAIDPQLI